VIDNAKQLGHDEPSGGTKAMSNNETHDSTTAFEAAQRQLFAACGIQIATRRVRLGDPPLAVRVLEAGEGPPVLLVHALSTPGLRHVVARIGSPSVAITRRSLARSVIGPRAAELAPDGFFAVVHEGMRQPGFRTAMVSHMWLAMRLGRPRPENFLSDAELRDIAAHVLMIWGDEDPTATPRSAGAPPHSSTTRTSRSSPGATPPSSTTPNAAVR
jgi:hypothetical protein